MGNVTAVVKARIVDELNAVTHAIDTYACWYHGPSERHQGGHQALPGLRARKATLLWILTLLDEAA